MNNNSPSKLMDTILYDELLQEIFHRLPPPSSSAVSLTSKRWLHLFRSSLSSLSLHLSTNNHHHSLFTFLSQHTYLSSLTITTTTTTTTTTSFSDNLLTTISSTCPNLTRLHLFSGPVSSPHILTLSTKLTSLSIIISRHHFTLHFLAHFKNLKHLSLSIIGSSNIQIPKLPSQPHSQSQLQLNSLSLSGILSGDYPLSFLWSNTCHQTLTKLTFNNCQGVGDIYSFSCLFKTLESLNEVELKTCRSIISLILSKLTENGCRSLSSLLIYDGGCKESLLHFIRETNSINLNKIDFRLPLDLYDDHLFEIGLKFKQLRVLRLQSCSMVTGEGIKSLGLALSHYCLQELGLTNCDVMIKRQGGFLVDLAQNMKRIKILDLSYNHMLMDKEFVSMISSYSDLRILKLRGCTRLTHVSMISLSRNCKRLESVDLVYCHGVRVEGVEFVILNCSELRKVQVEDWKVSQVATRWMADKFIELQP
uniref:F-box/LRR-repeat protein 4 n=1 Tax=Erigeron canadensis TaxID=72917 RepID=UPI001CB9ACBC|nr:F-box/LRR-repeat protein 4 [Erigeron canadensis]